MYESKRRIILDRLCTMLNADTNPAPDEEYIIGQLALTMGVSVKLVKEIADNAKKYGFIKK